MRIPDCSWESTGYDCYGGHADVFQCTYNGIKVAVKVPRTNLSSDLGSVLGVSFSLTRVFRRLE